MWSSALRLALVCVVALVSVQSAIGRADQRAVQMTDLCQDGALVRVALDADGKPAIHAPCCPDCLSAAAPGLPAVTPVPQPLPQRLWARLRRAPGHKARLSLRAPAFRARGPPGP